MEEQTLLRLSINQSENVSICFQFPLLDPGTDELTLQAETFLTVHMLSNENLTARLFEHLTFMQQVPYY